MHKFEQQRKGRQSPTRGMSGYGQIQQGTPPQHTPASQGPPAPPGWRQEFDPQTRRWYYLNLVTGHSQWDSPTNSQPLRAQTFANDRTGTPRDENLRIHSPSLPQRPLSSSDGRHSLNLPRAGEQGHGTSASPHPNGHGRLPPGAHYDTSTGQVVYSMFPPGQTPEQWAQEVGRV